MFILTNRRRFLKAIASSLSVMAVLKPVSLFAGQLYRNFKEDDIMTITLPDLPYDRTALEPHISAETLDYHYGKHHRAYVTNLNNLIKGTDLEGKTLDNIISIATNNKDLVGVYNNAAQIWNHTFYWHSMAPNGGGSPVGKIKELIEDKFGSFDNFKNSFAKAGASLFGSGWVWLVLDKSGKIDIVSTSNAIIPDRSKYTLLLTMDVWEHAYYVDQRNARPAYIEKFFEVINWDFANNNL